MAKAAEKHHQTEFSVHPSVGIGQNPLPKRSVPVAVIYDLNPKPEPEPVVKKVTAWPKVSSKSMFFSRKPRSIEDDPFLRRLARLK